MSLNLSFHLGNEYQNFMIYILWCTSKLYYNVKDRNPEKLN